MEKISKKAEEIFNFLENEKLPLGFKSSTSLFQPTISSNLNIPIMCAFELWGSNIENGMSLLMKIGD